MPSKYSRRLILRALSTTPTFSSIYIDETEDYMIKSIGSIPSFYKYFYPPESCHDIILAPNNMLYLINEFTGRVVKLNPSNDQITVINAGTGSTSDRNWTPPTPNAILLPNGIIYAFAIMAGGSRDFAVLKIDTNNDIVTKIGVENNHSWVSPVYAPNGKIYAMPRDTETTFYIMKFDPISDTFTYISPSPIYPGIWKNLIYGNNGNLYAIPASTGGWSSQLRVVKINITTDEVSYLNVPFYTDRPPDYADGWRSAILAPTNGMIYAFPNSTVSDYPNSILKLNPVNDTMSLIGNPYVIDLARWHEKSNCVIIKDNIYYAEHDPINNIQYLIKLNTSYDTVSFIEVGRGDGEEIDRLVLGRDGQIYLLPYYDGNCLMKFNPVTESVKKYSMASGGTSRIRKYSSYQAVGDYIYAIQAYYRLLKIDTKLLRYY